MRVRDGAQDIDRGLVVQPRAQRQAALERGQRRAQVPGLCRCQLLALAWPGSESPLCGTPTSQLYKGTRPSFARADRGCTWGRSC